MIGVETINKKNRKYKNLILSHNLKIYIEFLRNKMYNIQKKI